MKAVTSGPNYSVILAETLQNWNVNGNDSDVELFPPSQGKWREYLDVMPVRRQIYYQQEHKETMCQTLLNHLNP